ncbi:N-acetylmuramoyl-L-alanine amidase family protein, partial [Clostridium butyricum]
MFNRTSKMTALLVAAAAVTSIVPATAAERLGTKEGTITNAIAFDGAYVYDGYRTDDDDAGLYFNNGKDKMVDEDEDYSYDNLSKYGTKYATIEDGDTFLVDLSNG